MQNMPYLFNMLDKENYHEIIIFIFKTQINTSSLKVFESNPVQQIAEKFL